MDVEGRLTGEKPNVDPTAFLLLGGDPEKKSMSAMYYQWPIVGCTVFGLGAAFFHNYMTRRPRLAGENLNLFQTACESIMPAATAYLSVFLNVLRYPETHFVLLDWTRSWNWCQENAS